MSNNRKHLRLESCVQEHLFENFNEEGHHVFSEDISMTFINKAEPLEPLKRKNYLKSILKSMAPLSLNVEGSIWEISLRVTDYKFIGQDFWIKILVIIIYHLL